MSNAPHLEETKVLNPDWDKRGGLLPVIVQEQESRQVLMLGYANPAALAKTMESGLATFWSTSRKAMWTKGETSGDHLRIREIRIDCDQDALLYLVEVQGQGACHTQNEAGNTRPSCFYRKLKSGEKLDFLPGME